MPGFKLPPISPLVGSTRSTFFRVLKENRVHPKYRFKVGVTVVLLMVSSAFHWVDRLVLPKKVNSFVFKESPLFIIGHWRSGTTFLHNLLTKDPVAGYTTTYQAVFPNNMKSKWLFKTFMRVFMPDERPGDGMKIAVNLPQEDEYALSNITHRAYYHFFYFPSSYPSLYKESIRFDGVSEEELKEWKKNYQQMVIKALINTNGDRPVLKNPLNTGRMLQLLDIFQEAKLIFIIRNPVIVYLSTKKFYTQLFPVLNLEKFSNEDISNMILEIYVKLLHDYLEDKKQVNTDQLLEVRYEELVERPMDVLERIYKNFGYSGFQELEPVFQNYLDDLNGYKMDSYTMDQRELDRVMDHVGFAMEHWNYQMPENLKIVENQST